MSLGVERDRVTAQLRALAHPVRLRILSLLTGAPMTAAEVARELGLTHANASYHLRQLNAVGELEIAGEEHIRGGVAKRYRHVPDLTDKPARVPGQDYRPQRRAVYAAMASELRRRAKHAKDTPGRAHLTDAELWVDPDVWADVRARVQAASDTLHRAARAPRAPGTIRVNASMALFEMELEAGA
jgi:DNA-binding transcriptional ArsR family regulator